MNKASNRNDSAEPSYIGGFHAVFAALEGRRPVRQLWLAEGRRQGRLEELAGLAEQSGVPVAVVPMTQLDNRLPGIRHQGCVAELAAPRTYRESELPQLLAAAGHPWVLALDQVQDPHNLGACLRTAAAAGVTAVIAPRKRAAGMNATVSKVAAGAADRVPFIPVTNLSRALQRLQKEGLWVVGLDGGAQQTIYEADLPAPLVWVAGSEASGLRELTARHCDLLVSIPMAGNMESVNVSVATGIALFETVRRQRGKIAKASQKA